MLVRRVVRKAALVLGTLIAVLVLLLAGALLTLNTQWGSRQVLERILPLADDTLAGGTEVDRLHVGIDRLVLVGVRLRDPEGGLVAEIERIEVVFSPLSLLSRRIDIWAARLERPRIYLVQDERGLNLTRALAPVQPRPDATRPASSQLVIAVGRLVLSGGTFELRAQGEANERTDRRPDVHIAGLAARGSGRYDVGKGQLHATLELTGSSRAPYPAPLALWLEGELASAAARATLSLSLGANRLAGQLQAVQAQAGDRQTFTLRQLHLTPDLVRAFVPAWPFQVAVEARGRLSRRGSEVGADLTVDTSGGRIVVEGSLNLDSRRSRGIEIRGERVNLNALYRPAPVSLLSFTLKARGGGRDLRRLDGEAQLTVAPGTIASLPTGPVRLRLQGEDGQYRLRELFAALPGLDLTASGRADPRGLSVEAQLRAHDLARAFRALAAGAAPALAGHGEVSARVEGRWRAPSLALTGRFPHVRYRAHHGRALAFRVRAPDLRRPQLARAKLDMASLTIGPRRLHRLAVSAQTDRRRLFRASLDLRQPQPVSMQVAGRWSEDLEELTLGRLTLSYPEASWRLRRAARLAFGNVRRVEGLQLYSGRQEVELSLLQSARKLRAHLRLEAIDLSRLPGLVQATAPELAGQLDATVTAGGSPERPRIHAQGTLRNGRIAYLNPIALTFDTWTVGRRLDGEIQARVLGGQITTRFDLPRAYPPPHGSTVDLSVQAESVELDRLLAALGRQVPGLDGTAGLRAHIQGRAHEPRVEVWAQVQDLVAAGQPVGQAQLSLLARPGVAVTADLNVRLLGRTGTAHVRTPLDLGRLLRHRSTVRLRDLPFEATAHFDNLPIEPMARLSGLTTRFGGIASLSFDVRGTVSNPVGSLQLMVDGAHGPGIPPTDARLEVRSRDTASGLTASLSVSRADRTLATARASLAIAATRLGDPAALARAPVRLEATLEPIDLQRLVAPVNDDRRPPRVLGGRLQARLQMEGTLGAPQLTVAARAEQVTLQGIPLGQGHLLLAYARQRPQVDLRFESKDGGYLTLAATSEVDLGYPLPAGGLALRRLPITAQLRAERFDLTPLSCLSDLVRVVEGRLAAEAHVDGRLGTPRIRGRLEWSNGRLILAGLGEYRDIHLLLQGDENRLTLEELVARSGRGSARLSGSAERRNGGELRLAAQAALHRFPIRAAGQPIATLSTSPRFHGQASLDRLTLVAEVDGADLWLAPGKLREVQSLERLDDVVLFWGDEPLNRTQARKHAALVQARRELLAARAPPGLQPDEAPPDFTPGSPLAELQVRAANNIWVRGPDINVELGLGPQFVVLAGAEPSIFGTVLVRRGQVEVLGRRFRLQDSSVIRFVGPPDRPILDVRAVHQPRHAPDLSVVVTLSGAVDELEVAVTAPGHPEYGQADLLTAILTGRPPEQPAEVSPEATTRAASLLGGFLADKLQATLLRRLPIDVLNIDPGEGLRALQLEAGTYLGDDLYVAYVGRYGSDPFLRENQNEVQLEYRLSQRWSFEASYGDARRGAADLVWTKRY
jgi:translocation and assembly module TamB